MIPILYAATETAFTTNGKGRLTDIISATVTEERNGVYELEFVYPVNGKLYSELLNGGIVACWHDDTHTIQPFDLYKRTAPLDGKVTFNARHIRYRQANIILKPFTGSSCSDTLSKIVTNSANTNPFTYSTDKAVSGAFTLDRPRSVQSLLMGEEGSILDVYGKGDYEFDRFNVILHANRGTDRGVTIRYAKNLSDLTDDYSEDGVFTAVAPYWAGNEGVVYPSEVIVTSPNAPAAVVPVALDLSGSFQNKPTEAQLRTEAVRQLNAAQPWLPTRNIKVDFAALWQTTEYASVAVLERLALCDTVSVIYDQLGVNVKQKVIKVVYDVLSERYSEMELGATSETLTQAVLQSLSKTLKDKASISFMRDAVADATAQITGGLGGYVVLKLNAAGQPEELLIMDTPDTSTAINVWRFNQGGLGHSHSGYNGPFNDIALTQDGKINANMITTGILDGDIVNVRNLRIIDSNGNIISTWTSSGITLGKTTDSHAIVNFNSFDLYDKDGNRYLHFGDSRNAAGRANRRYLAYNRSGVIPWRSPTLSGLVAVTAVYVNGTALDASLYTVSNGVVTITNGVVGGAEVDIRYTSTDPVYAYTLGNRDTNYFLGPTSLTVGENLGASADDTIAVGSGHVVVGSKNAALGGMVADIKGENSVTLGGEGLRARSSSQVVSGQYNVADSSRIGQRGSYIEIVGNGVSSSQRSNARTLDWGGNEWLAGQLNADSVYLRSGADARGNIEMTGAYALRKLPATIADSTSYYGLRFAESDGSTFRGGVQFFRNPSSGDATRIVAGRTVNGSMVTNILGLYVDATGNKVVGLERIPWVKALGLAYTNGDGFILESSSYVVMAGNLRASKQWNFTIPLSKPVDASVVDVHVAGKVVIVGLSTTTGYFVADLNNSSSPSIDACSATATITPAGVAVHCEFAAAQAWWAANKPVAIQAYGLYVMFGSVPNE